MFKIIDMKVIKILHSTEIFASFILYLFYRDANVNAFIIAENCTNFNYLSELQTISDSVTRDLLDTMRTYALYFVGEFQ